LQRLLGHASLQTTEIYLHVIEAMSNHLVSPLDRLNDFADSERQRDEGDEGHDSGESDEPPMEVKSERANYELCSESPVGC
jgi:hypothetical protein